MLTAYRRALGVLGAYARARAHAGAGPASLHVELAAPGARMPGRVLYKLLSDFAGAGHWVTFSAADGGLPAPVLFMALETCQTLRLHTTVRCRAEALAAPARQELVRVGCGLVDVRIAATSWRAHESREAGAGYAAVVENVHALAAQKGRSSWPMALRVELAAPGSLAEAAAFRAYWGRAGGVDAVAARLGPSHAQEGAAPPAARCPVPWAGPVFAAADAKLYVCEALASAGAPMGDLLVSSLPGIWNSPEFQNLRSQHAAGAVPETCVSCPKRGAGPGYGLAETTMGPVRAPEIWERAGHWRAAIGRRLPRMPLKTLAWGGAMPLPGDP